MKFFLASPWPLLTSVPRWALSASPNQGDAARRATEWLGTCSCSPAMAEGRENPTECESQEGRKKGRRKGGKGIQHPREASGTEENSAQ